MKKSRTSRLLMGKTYTLQWIKKYDMREGCTVQKFKNHTLSNG